MHGPPGTGKTLLAKAVAGESGANFYFQSASAFVEMWSGLGAARIRKLFATARENQPAIIFIDELDAVGAKRVGGGNNREHDQTLNQLLVELDGFDEHDRLVVVAASNRLEDLDPALLRPGRFDRHVLINPPDVTGREQILASTPAPSRSPPTCGSTELARQTAGLTGADLANICNEAAISAGRAHRDRITDDDFANALERVVAGLEQRKLITDKEKRVIAYHEAGHALIAHLTSEDIHKVTILPRGRALGMMMRLPEEDRHLASEDELEDWLQDQPGRPRGRADRVRPDHQRCGLRPRPRHVDRAHDGVRLGHGRDAPARCRCGPTTTRCRRRPSSCATASCARSPSAPWIWRCRMVAEHRVQLDRLALALLERETLSRLEIAELLSDLEPVSDASRLVGVEIVRRQTWSRHHRSCFRAA